MSAVVLVTPKLKKGPQRQASPTLLVVPNRQAPRSACAAVHRVTASIHSAVARVEKLHMAATGCYTECACAYRYALGQARVTQATCASSCCADMSPTTLQPPPAVYRRGCTPYSHAVQDGSAPAQPAVRTIPTPYSFLLHQLCRQSLSLGQRTLGLTIFAAACRPTPPAASYCCVQSNHASCNAARRQRQRLICPHSKSLAATQHPLGPNPTRQLDIQLAGTCPSAPAAAAAAPAGLAGSGGEGRSASDLGTRSSCQGVTGTGGQGSGKELA